MQTSLKLANHLRQLFERSDTSDNFEEEDENEEEDGSSDQNLNIQRLPVFVYKFPVDKHSGFGDGYEGMETEVQLENIALCVSLMTSSLSGWRGTRPLSGNRPRENDLPEVAKEGGRCLNFARAGWAPRW